MDRNKPVAEKKGGSITERKQMKGRAAALKQKERPSYLSSKLFVIVIKYVKHFRNFRKNDINHRGFPLCLLF